MAARVDDQIYLLSAYESSIEETVVKTGPVECLNNTNKMDELILDLGSNEEPEPSTVVSVTELTGDKTFHLFISSASDERDAVLPIVEELEKKFGVKCLFHDRDFTPGTAILHNIMEGIDASMRTVIFLTPKFTSSRYCVLELEMAMNNSMETGLNSIIPVLLQDCEIPSFLKPRTYINATLPGMTTSKLAFDIKESLLQAEPASKYIPVKFTNKHSKYKNGTSVSIVADVKRLCLCRPNLYKFCLTHTTLRLLKDRNIDVSPNLLQRVITLLNNDPLLNVYDERRKEFKNICSLMCRCICGLCPLTFFFCFAVYTVLALCITTERPSEKSAHLMATSSWVEYVPIILTIICGLSIAVFNSHRERNALRNLNETLWSEITSRTYKDGLAFSFCISYYGPPSLNVMRYDVKECKEYLVTLLECRACEGTAKERQNLELRADNIIRSWVKIICSDDFDSLKLPEADQNRHNVVKDRMCLCQLYERNNPPG